MLEASAALRSYDISDGEYARVQTLLYDIAGIKLGDSKKTLVVSRLARRLGAWQLDDFTQYLRLLEDAAHSDELQLAVDLLTTNETYFFSEEKHFEVLGRLAAAHSGNQSWRVWSAACSFGQEAWSIAMTLDSVLQERPWEVLASDISTRVLETARSGRYPLAQAERIPKHHLLRYCLKGIGSQEGCFMIDNELRRRVSFFHANLLAPPQGLGVFDVIFLRNVMIYFDIETKRQVVAGLLPRLKRGGHLIIGHSESLNGITGELQMLAPSIFRKN
jgi:chemotaxis protein methyltransferase CheR